MFSENETYAPLFDYDNVEVIEKERILDGAGSESSRENVEADDDQYIVVKTRIEVYKKEGKPLCVYVYKKTDDDPTEFHSLDADDLIAINEKAFDDARGVKIDDDLIRATRRVKVMACNERLYNPFDLKCADFADIVPIATALSRIHRFWGQTDYTVAQHCVVMAEYFLSTSAEYYVAHWALLHEVAEAFLGDVPTPIKAMLPEYKALEEKVLNRMAICLQLPYPMSPAIKIADKKAMFEEALNFMPGKVHWEEEARKARVIPSDRRLVAWSMDEAKWRFINLHKLLLELREIGD